MSPLGAAMKKLKAVIVKVASESETAGEFAGSQDDECFGSNNLVHVGDDHDVPLRWGPGASKAREDLCEEGVSLQSLIVPCYDRMKVLRILQLVVDDLVKVRGQLIPVLLDVQRLLQSGEGPGGLDNDEVVDKVIGGVEADLKPVQLGVDGEEIEDLALGKAAAMLQGMCSVEDSPSVLLAECLRKLGLRDVGGGETLAVEDGRGNLGDRGRHYDTMLGTAEGVSSAVEKEADDDEDEQQPEPLFGLHVVQLWGFRQSHEPHDWQMGIVGRGVGGDLQGHSVRTDAGTSRWWWWWWLDARR